MYYGQVIPTSPDASAEAFRDVTDDWGFTFRQYADGTVVVLSAPQEGIFGDLIPGSSGGPLEGTMVSPDPTDALWAQITERIGPHPHQVVLTQIESEDVAYESIAEAQEEAEPTYYDGAVYSGWGRLDAGGRPRRTARRVTRGWGAPGMGAAPAVQTINDILSGFTTEPTGEAGEITQNVTAAIPGIQATIYQITTPATLEGMSKKLGKLKGELATTHDPVKRAMLEEQIGALQYKIDTLKGQMAPTTPTTLAASTPWWPFAALAGLALLLGGAFAVSRRAPAR